MPDARAPFPAGDLRGRSLTDVVVGWHIHGDSRTEVLLYLQVSGVGWLEAHTAGDGSLQLIPQEPEAFDMDEYGRFEMHPAAPDHPLVGLIGHPISGVRQFVWRGATIAVELHAADKVAVIANEADEVFVSTGALPPDYAGEAVPLDHR